MGNADEKTEEEKMEEPIDEELGVAKEVEKENSWPRTCKSD